MPLVVVILPKTKIPARQCHRCHKYGHAQSYCTASLKDKRLGHQINMNAEHFTLYGTATNKIVAFGLINIHVNFENSLKE
nr:unnamed protein product [Callosobruchus chinensis]